MKKLALAILFIALGTSQVFAEISAVTYSGNSNQRYWEQQVFVDAYNNSGSSISSNYVVIIDTTAANIASGTTLGTYINTTTTSQDARVLGITDQTIANGSVGKVCVRGPHKCYLTGIAGLSAGATLASMSTAGALGGPTSATKGGIAATLLSSTVIGGNPASYLTVPTVSDGYIPGEGTSNYWVWFGGPASN